MNNSTAISLKNKKDGLIKIFLLYSCYQFLLHTYFTVVANDPRLFMPAVIAFLHDVAVLGILIAIGYFVKYLSPIRFKKTVDISFSILTIIVGVFLASYPKILREYLVFPVNILESDISTVKVFISDYLGIAALLPSLIALILGVFVLIFPKELKISNKVKLIGLIIILTIFGLTLLRPSPQPFVFSLQNTIESILKNEKRIVPSLTRTFPDPKTDTIQDELKYSISGFINYKHILLIVFEGVTSKDFEKNFSVIQNGFYDRNKCHSVYYNNYYATNMDSYTSLISMVTGIQVPYRAYTDERIYYKVNSAPSITHVLWNRGFYNSFISTYEYQPFVPTRDYWNNIYDRKDLSINNWLSIGSSRMESATEDKAAISTIVDNLKIHENTFILHELVYGHSPEWFAKTGKTQLDYYNEYLLELSEKLEKEKLLSTTLFVIVSDHGDRAKSSEADNYRVPLLIVGEQISYQIRDELLNHLDLPQIIYHYAASEEHPVSRDKMFFVGSTEKWIYGQMNKKGECLFIDDAAGTILSQMGGLKPIEVRNEFQNNLNIFNSIF